jgi:hypothetical protein
VSKENLNKAFRDLRKHGYFARQNFLCCQSCGWAEVPDNKSDKVVFYHTQDNDDLQRSGSCHLAWSGNGQEIVEIFHKHGITVEWDNSLNTRMKIYI